MRVFAEPGSSAAAAVVRYYRVPAVRDRILEFAGDRVGTGPSCAYLSALPSDVDDAGPEQRWERARRHPPRDLEALLDRGADVSRSLWDRHSLLVLCDVDYLNADYPGEAFLHPARVFVALEPTYRAFRAELRRLGLPFLCVMTGRGYHFVGEVPLVDPLVSELAGLVPRPPGWVDGVSARHESGQTPRLDARHARAFVGAGMLVEHLAHRVLRRAAPGSPLPVVMNGIVVGNCHAGRECVSIDLSHFGDPLDVRHVRAAFSAYQHHRYRPDVFGHHVSATIGPLVSVPRLEHSLPRMLVLRRVGLLTGRLAARCRTRIPVVTAGLGNLLHEYERSALARFHRDFSVAGPDRPAGTHVLDMSPPCVAEPLRHPNDLLLQPARAQHVTRALLAHGWSPRAIATLFRALFREDFGWGDHWGQADPDARAEFDVRVFAGLALAGPDEAIDFNCVSAQEKGLCPGVPCHHDLRLERAGLLGARRSWTGP